MRVLWDGGRYAFSLAGGLTQHSNKNKDGAASQAAFTSASATLFIQSFYGNRFSERPWVHADDHVLSETVQLLNSKF